MNAGNADDPLDFEHHLRIYQAHIGHGNSRNDEHFIHEAQSMHSLKVQDALRDSFVDAVSILESLQNKEADNYIRFGAARRLRMMWVSYREILSIIEPDRKEPLPGDDVSLVERDLNVIYINISGVLDNYAWCLLNEAATEPTKKLSRMHVGMFSSRFISDPNFEVLKPDIDRFSDWNKELKDKRDPAAHRIPLTVPPSVLNQEEGKRYKELHDAWIKASAEQQFDEADKYSDQQDSLGTFMPCFLHHPDEGVLPIYPTVPQDIANLVKISGIIHAYLKNRIS